MLVLIFYNSYKSDLLEYKDKNEMFPKNQYLKTQFLFR